LLPLLLRLRLHGWARATAAAVARTAAAEEEVEEEAVVEEAVVEMLQIAYAAGGGSAGRALRRLGRQPRTA
jgi:hypothetical protein